MENCFGENRCKLSRKLFSMKARHSAIELSAVYTVSWSVEDLTDLVWCIAVFHI